MLSWIACTHFMLLETSWEPYARCYSVGTKNDSFTKRSRLGLTKCCSQVYVTELQVAAHGHPGVNSHAVPEAQLHEAQSLALDSVVVLNRVSNC